MTAEEVRAAAARVGELFHRELWLVPDGEQARVLRTLRDHAVAPALGVRGVEAHLLCVEQTMRVGDTTWFLVAVDENCTTAWMTARQLAEEIIGAPARPAEDEDEGVGGYAGARPGPVPNFETRADRTLAERIVRDDAPRVQALAGIDGSVQFEAEAIGYRDHPSFDLRRDDGVVRSWPAGLVRELPPCDPAGGG